MKVNIDVALFEDIYYICVGSVVRGADGNFIMAMNKRHNVLLPPREVEALFLKEVLMWLKETRFRKCILETDSQVLARAFKGMDGRSFFPTIV